MVYIFMDFEQARSSVGERYLDAVEVGGSIPPAPTRLHRDQWQKSSQRPSL